MGELRICVAVTSCFFCAGCANLPSLQEATGGIPVRDIVLRVKCELSSAFETADGRWIVDDPKFGWLRSWTAQVDLTLQVLDNATLAPGGTLTQPFHNAYATTAGPSSISTSGVPGTSIASISQSLAVSAGASVGAQAQRTETLGFALSVQELHYWRKSPGTDTLCMLSDGSDLNGRLGIREWVAEALSPVASQSNPRLRQYLWGGVHPKPASPAPSPVTAAIATPASPSKTGKAAPLLCANYDAAKSEMDHVQALVSSDHTLGNATAIIKAATQSANASSKDIDGNASSATSLIQAVNKAAQKYKRVNGEYAGVLDPSLSIEFNKKKKEWDKVIHSAQLLVDAISKEKKDALSLELIIDVSAQKALQIPIKTNALAAKFHELPTEASADQVQAICNEIGVLGDMIGQSSDVAASVQSDATQLANYAQASDVNLKNLKDYTDTLNDDISSLPSIDPPISTIGQAVQFILNASGNVTPTWTFARVSGPTGTLFSGGKTRTHMLNFTLGPVSPGSFNAPNPAVSQNQTNLLFDNLFFQRP